MNPFVKVNKIVAEEMARRTLENIKLKREKNYQVALEIEMKKDRRSILQKLFGRPKVYFDKQQAHKEVYKIYEGFASPLFAKYPEVVSYGAQQEDIAKEVLGLCKYADDGHVYLSSITLESIS